MPLTGKALSEHLRLLATDLNGLSRQHGGDLKLARELNEIRDRLVHFAEEAVSLVAGREPESRPAFEVFRGETPFTLGPKPGAFKERFTVGSRVRNAKYGWTGRVVAVGSGEGEETVQVEWDRGQKGLPTVQWAGVGSLEKAPVAPAKTVRQIVEEANAEEPETPREEPWAGESPGAESSPLPKMVPVVHGPVTLSREGADIETSDKTLDGHIRLEEEELTGPRGEPTHEMGEVITIDIFNSETGEPEANETFPHTIAGVQEAEEFLQDSGFDVTLVG